MSEQIHWTLNVQVTGGPKIAAAQTETLEAYDKITIDVPQAQDTDTPGQATVEVQPGNEGQVQFLLVKSSVYDESLTYQVNGTGDPIALNALLILIGTGAIGLLGAAPQTLSFSNRLERVVSIEILVGRRATPPPP